ncbi:MAG: tetratricopeptide repeat protein, partial [Deltaproteobacteria bacterium]
MISSRPSQDLSAAECFRRATTARDAGNFAAAEASLRQALRLDQANAKYNASLANILMRADRLAEAQPLWDAAIRLCDASGPERVKLAAYQNNLGVCLQKQNKLQEAAQSYRRAAQGAQDKPAYAQNLEDCLRALQLGAPAKAHALDVAGPAHAANADGQASSWYKRGQEAMPAVGVSEVAAYAQALRFFGIAAAKQPEQARFSYKIANIYHLRLKQPAQAHPYYQAAVRAEPHNPQWRNGLGGCLEDLGRAAEALPHYDAAQQAEPNNAAYRDNFSRCRNKQQAIADFVSPNIPHAAAAPAFAAPPQQAPSGLGEAELRRLLAAYPDHPEHNFALAQCLVGLGRFAEALPHFAR